MRGTVANDFEASLVFGGNDRQLAVLLDAVRSIDLTTIDACAEGGFGQAGAYRSGDLGDRYGRVELLTAAIGKRNCGHVFSLRGLYERPSNSQGNRQDAQRHW